MNWSKLAEYVVLGIGACVMIYVATSGEPQLRISVANGLYSNPCCGTLILTDGRMTLGGQNVSYVIERDKIGPYVLPQGYVGASGSGFVIRPNGHQMKLRLDASSMPHRIELINDRPRGAVYSFGRSDGS